MKVLIGAPEYPEKGAKINQLRIQLISKLLSQERVADAELVVRQIAPLYRDKLIIVCCKQFFEKKDFAHLLEWANQIEASAKKDELFEECSRDCLEKEEYSSAIEWAHKIRDPSYRDEMMEGVVRQICFFKNKEEARAVTKEITDPERREKAIKKIDDYEPDD